MHVYSEEQRSSDQHSNI